MTNEVSIHKKLIKVFSYSRVSIFHEINFAVERQIFVLIRFYSLGRGKRNLDDKKKKKWD